MSERFKIIGGILCLVIHDSKILMFKRKNKFDAGMYSVPGGCLEDNETIVAAAVRELKEEVNLIVKEEDCAVVSMLHRIAPLNWNAVELIVLVRKFSGEPKIMEAEKSENLQWFELNNLPENISRYARKGIENYLSGERFSEITY